MSSELPVLKALILNAEPEIEDSSEIQNVTVAQTEDASNIEHAETNVTTEVLDSIVPNKYTNDYQGVEIKNGTDCAITDEMLNVDNLDINKTDIMIFHTHTCESYTPTENFQYVASGNFRTTDLNYSVARVGDSLSEQLISYGYNVIHDKTYHDYPAYSGSYGRSMATVENLLLTNPGTDIIIDLHRDAIGSRSDYAPTVRIGDEEAAQIMFVIGTNAGGLWHPNWNQNLKFAIKVQEKAEELYPGLFKPIMLTKSRYNQHTGKYASIIEVGATRKYTGTMFNKHEISSKSYG